MKYSDIQAKLAAARNKLDAIFEKAYNQARSEIRGDWTDPHIRQRSRERAIEIADQELRHTVVAVAWVDRETMVDAYKEMDS